MKWLSLEKKKKRKLGTSLLVLGTGGGDVLALDVASGQLKWRINDCHPGGGADGMVCEIDPHSGNLIRKFKASTKAVSSLSVSPDGKILATASSQLKTFKCSDLKKMQKSKKGQGVQNKVTTLDRAHAEDALLPNARVADLHILEQQLAIA